MVVTARLVPGVDPKLSVEAHFTSVIVHPVAPVAPTHTPYTKSTTFPLVTVEVKVTCVVELSV